jgi:hypothetical protein
MTNAGGFAIARCLHCREPVQVPERYAHGDHIKCGACGTKHKVVRGDRLRLVLADVGPLRESLEQNESLVARLESEIERARFSFGIGANGVAVGVAYAIYQVVANQEPIGSALWEAAGIAVVLAVLLEAANWAFLAKRQRIMRLTRELEEARLEGTRIRSLLRDASKV